MPQPSRGPESCCSFELVVDLLASGAAFKGFGEPGLEARVDMLLAITLAAGTTVTGIDIDVLAGASATCCRIIEGG